MRRFFRTASPVPGEVDDAKKTPSSFEGPLQEGRFLLFLKGLGGSFPLFFPFRPQTKAKVVFFFFSGYATNFSPSLFFFSIRLAKGSNGLNPVSPFFSFPPPPPGALEGKGEVLSRASFPPFSFRSREFPPVGIPTDVIKDLKKIGPTCLLFLFLSLSSLTERKVERESGYYFQKKTLKQ